MSVSKLFQKYYNMKPYLQIDEEDWQHIMKTYEKDEVVDELAKCLHTYPCPIPDISEKETIKSLNLLKGIKFKDLLIEKEWFPRNERKSKF